MTLSASTDAAPDGGTFSAVLQQAVLEAGRVVMKYYADGCIVERKKDSSPVTEADRAAEAIILKAIASIAPDIPVVAEEAAAAGHIPADPGRRFLLVDPLDGTKEFLLHNGDFTVNIGLIEDGAPVFGIVYAPARNLLFTGGSDGAVEMTTDTDHRVTGRRKIAVRAAPQSRVGLCSRSHMTPETERFLADNRIETHMSVGSSLKFCMIARGEADIYPRFSPTMQWDTAAGDAVLRAAGGMTVGLEGRPLAYRPRGDGGVSRFANSSFVAYGAGPAPVFAAA